MSNANKTCVICNVFSAEFDITDEDDDGVIQCCRFCVSELVAREDATNIKQFAIKYEELLEEISSKFGDGPNKHHARELRRLRDELSKV